METFLSDRVLFVIVLGVVVMLICTDHDKAALGIALAGVFIMGVKRLLEDFN